VESSLESPMSESQAIIKRINFHRQGWVDRSFKDAETNDTLYFCECPPKWPGAKFYFHRDGKGGPLHATITRKAFSTAVTFRFANETQVNLEPRAYLGFSRKAYFNYGGKRYRWQGYKKLTAMESGDVIAKFNREFFAVGRDGQMEIYEGGRDMIDVIVGTCMMCLFRHQREERREIS